MKLLILLFLIMSSLAFAQVDANTFEEDVDNGVNLLVRNDEYSPVTLTFTLNLTNMVATPARRTVVVPARAERFLAFELRFAPGAAQFGLGYEYVTNIGDHTQAGYDSTYVYELPVAPGETVHISQGYNGHFSHRNRLALDFNLKEGTGVYAARAGVVTEVIEHNIRGCPREECLEFENRIVVYHDDGTFAGYAHLRKNGALVEVGDRVEQGQLIGKSGSTGFANGPHLHFSVYRQKMDGQEYVPTRFRTAGTQVPELLKERGKYRRPAVQ